MLNQKISIIIPALNEGTDIEQTLLSLKEIDGELEIIVVDGGSTDNTVSIAAKHVKVLCSAKGRACQMNTGAKIAKGDIFLFLHADSVITAEGIANMQRYLWDNPDVVGGSFKIAFNHNSLILKTIAFCSNIRARLFNIFFGDQGIFIRKELFQQINGFSEIPIMEDWDICKKLKTKGRLVQLPFTIITSNRRFHKHGTLKTLILINKLKILYLLGISPLSLKQSYPDN